MTQEILLFVGGVGGGRPVERLPGSACLRLVIG